MSGIFKMLFGGSKTSGPTPASGLQLQSSIQGIPVPILYGKTKVSGNMFWYGDFKSIKHKQKVGKGGGKAVSFTYQVGLIMGICEGQVASYGDAWTTAGKTTVADLGFTEFFGESTQAPWGYLTTNHAAEALNYKDIAYLANAAYNLGDQPYLPQLWFEVNNGNMPTIEYWQPNQNMLSDMVWNSTLGEIWFGLDNDPGNHSFARINPANGTLIGYIDVTYSGITINPRYKIFYDAADSAIWFPGFTVGSAYHVITKIDATTGAVLGQRTISSTTWVEINPVTGDAWIAEGGDYWKVNKASAVLASTNYTGSISDTFGGESCFDSAGNMYTACNAPTYDKIYKLPASTTTFSAVFTAGGGQVNFPFVYDSHRNVIWIQSFAGTMDLYPLDLSTYTLGTHITVPNYLSYLLSYDVNRDMLWGTNDLTAPNEVWGFNLTTLHKDYSYMVNYNPFDTRIVNESYPYVFLNGYWTDVSNTGNNALIRLGGIGASDEALPNFVIRDFLTHSRYGAGFPSALLDTASLDTDPSSYGYYCAAQDIKFSMLISQPGPAREFVTRWLEVTNTAAFWSGGKLKFAPYGDSVIVGSAVTFTPNTTVQYILTDDDFISEKDQEPITVTRADTYDCYNNYTLNTLDKNNEYNVATSESKDQASIESIGLRPASTIDAQFLSTPARGRLCAELIKNRQLYVRNRYKFRLSWEYALLEPMDIVTLTQADMGLNGQPVRILSIVEDNEGLMEFEAEEFTADVQYAPYYPAQAGIPAPITSYGSPSNTFVPVIFEPPYQLIKTSGPQVWLVAGGNPVTWGGCEVWVSLDAGSTYQQIGTIEQVGKVGTITATLAAFSSTNPDLTDTLSVDIATSGVMNNYATADAAAYTSLCYADGELLAYQNSAMTGTGLYNLTTIYRGLFGTVASSHASTTQFAQLDNAFKVDLPDSIANGAVVYVKLPAINPTGNETQDISVAAPYGYTITGIGRQVPDVIPGSVAGKPVVSQKVVNAIAPFAFDLPANLAGTVVTVGTHPTATAVFNIAKNGTNNSTISISTGGAITLSGTATSYAIGDTFTVTAPNPQDTTLADVAFNIAITKT